jgi:hypothetical protein
MQKNNDHLFAWKYVWVALMWLGSFSYFYVFGLSDGPLGTHAGAYLVVTPFVVTWRVLSKDLKGNKS